MAYEIPVREADKVVLGSVEPIAAQTINRGLARLLTNDLDMEENIPKLSISESDTTLDYLDDKIRAGTNIILTTEDIGDGAQILRIDALDPGTEVSGVTTTSVPTTDEGIVMFDGTTGQYIEDSGITKSDLVALSSDIDTLESDVTDLSTDMSAISADVASINTGISGNYILAHTLHLVGQTDGNATYVSASDTTKAAWTSDDPLVTSSHWDDILPINLSGYDLIEITGNKNRPDSSASVKVMIDTIAGTITGTAACGDAVPTALYGVTGSSPILGVNIGTAGSGSRMKFDSGSLIELPSATGGYNYSHSIQYLIKCYKKVT